MNRLPLFLLFLAASVATAQPQKPPAEEKPAAERKPLNLKLDQPARLFVQETPPEKNPDNLPALGGSGSAAFERAREPVRAERTSPYPVDTENMHR
jgi:hypothetical protein